MAVFDGAQLAIEGRTYLYDEVKASWERRRSMGTAGNPMPERYAS